MSNASGVSRGDRNRNALARLRELVPMVNGIVGMDLADKNADGRRLRSRLEGAGPADVPLRGLGPRSRVGRPAAVPDRAGAGPPPVVSPTRSHAAGTNPTDHR